MTTMYVNVYVGQTRSAGWISRLEALGWGEMCCRGELPARRRPWAFDNGAFKDFTAGVPFDGERFQQDLEMIWRGNSTPDFLAAPDIVAGGLDSLRFSMAWAPRMERHGPLYLVVQDGMLEEDVAAVLPGFAGIFVGGSKNWKHLAGAKWIRFAHERGIKAHVGRIGSKWGAKWAINVGADSIDSCLPLWGEENLQTFQRGLRNVDGDMFLEEVPPDLSLRKFTPTLPKRKKP